MESRETRIAPSSANVADKKKATEQISSKEVQLLKGMKRSIEIVLKKQTQSAFEIGNLLNSTKAQIKHGAFMPWIADNLTFNPRTAQLYMRIADVLSSSASYLTVFQQVTLSALAAKSMNDDVRRAILADIESGELRTDAAIADRIAKLAPQRAEKAAEAKVKRARARRQVAQLTREIAGERIGELIELLQAAGLAELATAIEEVATNPDQDTAETQLDTKTLETPLKLIDDESSASRANLMPFLVHASTD